MLILLRKITIDRESKLMKTKKSKSDFFLITRVSIRKSSVSLVEGSYRFDFF